MSYEEREKALRYLMFLKEKHDGSIKERRMCRWKVAMQVYKQGRYKLTYSIPGGNVIYMWDGCKGRTICHSDRHTGAFLHVDM